MQHLGHGAEAMVARSGLKSRSASVSMQTGLTADIELQQAQLRKIGALAHEFGIQADAIGRRQSLT